MRTGGTAEVDEMMRTGVVTTMTITMKTTRMVKATTMRMMKTMGTTPGNGEGMVEGAAEDGLRPDTPR
jgi:hypothetical protein